MEEEKKPWTSEEIIKLIAIAVIFIAIIAYSLLAETPSISKKDYALNKVDPIKIFEPIDDNYALVINKTINDKTETINYISDGTFKLYNIDGNKNGYLVYMGKTYYVESKNYKIKEYNNKVDIINNNF